MRILGASVFVGASIHAPFPVLLLRVDLEGLEEAPPNLQRSLLAGLAQALPIELESGESGSFPPLGESGLALARLLQRTLIGMQNIAGCRVSFGDTAGTAIPGIYEVVVAYESAILARAAAELGCDLMESLLPPEWRPRTAKTSFDWREERDAFVRWASELAGDATTRAVLGAARGRGLPCFELGGGLLQLGQGQKARRFHRSSMPLASKLAAELAEDKATTHALLAEIGLPLPSQRRVSDLEGALAAAEAIGYPVVIKRLRGHRGDGYSGELRSRDELRRAFQTGSGERLVQALVRGDEHRLLVIGDQVVMAVLRQPAQVSGDGRHTLRELVDEINCDPERGVGYELSAIRLTLDEAALAWLASHGLTADSVPKAGEKIRLRPSADWLLGGTVADVTPRLHPDWKEAAVQAVQMLGLEVAAVEIVTADPRTPPSEGGAIIEVEAAPDFQPFLAADKKRHDLGGLLVDRLAPPGPSLPTGAPKAPGAALRIPVAAITGTNGKTTTALLLTHLLELAGRRTGTACSDGLRIGGAPVLAGDMAGPGGARRVFCHPGVELAVLEVGCGGLLRHGLGFDQADVAAVLNVGADHLGQPGTDNLEQLARIKRLVIEAARGTAVLNADDPFCLRMADQVPSAAKVCYVTTFTKHSLVREHVRGGGRAVVLEEGPGGRQVVLYDGELRLPLLPVEAIPITRGGQVEANVKNALFATAIAWSLGLGLVALRQGLASFPASFEACPGRLQLFELLPFRVLLDRAHNPPAIEATLDFAARLPVTGRRICVLGAPGDRRDEDIEAMARMVAGRFDRYYCRRDHDLRGRAPDEIPRLLRQELLLSEVDEREVLMVPEETQAVAQALAACQPGDQLIVFASDVVRSWDQIVHFRPRELATDPESSTLAMPMPPAGAGAPSPGPGPQRVKWQLDPERGRLDAGD